MGFLRQIGKSVLSACVPPSRFLVRGRGAEESAPALSLTFDDGPDPEHTPRILDQLSRLGVRATFFVVGERAAAHPDLVKRIVNEGHEIGNHTWTHAAPHLIRAPEFLDEVVRTAWLLRDICSVDCRLVR